MNGDEFRPRTVRELEAEPPPKVLVANAIESADLIAGTGDMRFWQNFTAALGARVVFIEDRVGNLKSRWDMIAQADALRRDLPASLAPAVVIYCDPRSANWEFYEGEASAVIEAANPTFARVIHLREFDDRNKVIRIRERRVILEDITRPPHSARNDK